MKIKLEHYAHMKDAINAIAPRMSDMRVRIASDPRVKDAAKRLRWDCAYAAGLSGYMCDTIYKYADDNHIDTALRMIMKDMPSSC
jgi:hypothetical protein